MKKVELDGKKREVSSSVDAIGLFCPLPIVKLKIEFENTAQGEVVELLADDPGVLDDLPTWCKETSNKLLSLKKNEEDIFVAYIEKQGE